VPARVAAGDGALPVPAWFSLGVLVPLGAVEVPYAAVAFVSGEVGSRHRLQVGDEVRRGGGADVDAVDEGEVDGAGAQAAQERDGRRVVGRGHVDGTGSRALEFWRRERGGEEREDGDRR